jgi:predicted metal-binding membrane protein
MVQRSDWLTFNAWVLGASVLAIAGLFQFSPLKYHSLDKCRTPLTFIMQHWHGITPRLDAFLIGTHHGVFCVGCCWAIMLLMFVVGSGNVGWMLVLGAADGECKPTTAEGRYSLRSCCCDEKIGSYRCPTRSARPTNR